MGGEDVSFLNLIFPNLVCKIFRFQYKNIVFVQKTVSKTYEIMCEISIGNISIYRFKSGLTCLSVALIKLVHAKQKYLKSLQP